MTSLNSNKKTSILNTLLDNVEHQKNKRLAEKEKASKKTKITKLLKSSSEIDKEAKLKNDLLKFNEEGFIVVEADDIKKQVLGLTVSEGTKLIRSWKTNILRVYFAINSLKFVV